MGEEACRNCRSWEEEIYWNHFQCHQFSHILRDGFDRRLVIPDHFTKKLRKKLPKNMSLKGPSGTLWQVELTTIDDTVFVNHGWDGFVNDHLLQEKDLLVFKYSGDSCFDVLIFDGRNHCEKAASYFVRKCGQRDQDSGCQTKRKTGEISAEATLPSPGDFYEGPPPEKSVNNDIETPPMVQPISAQASTKKVRRQIEMIIPIHEDPCTSAEEIETKPDIESLNQGVLHDVPYISFRRLVSDEEKQNAIQLALATVTNDGFMVVMKPTHVYRRFFMSIPSVWMAKHMDSLEKQDIILRMKDTMWHTKFYYQKSKNSGGISSGWKSFATANELQEFDVCVFEPGSRINNAVVLDVNIFRIHHEDP